MIILIGGSSHVGKTYLAQKLLERTGFPYLSLDHLKMGLIRTGMTGLTVEDDYEMRYFLWPIAAEMIKTAVENRQNLIVEGCYIPGEWKESFTADYLKEIRCGFIVMTEEYIRKNMHLIREYASVIEQRTDDETDMERLIRCSRNFREDCVRFRIPCLEISEEYSMDELETGFLKMAGL